VIDWALRNTRGDADHVGLFGTSYGAGIALLAAARDPRIKAVVATSGWADFGAVFAEHDTVSTAALASLLGTVHKTGRPAGVLVRLAETLAGPRPSDAAGAIEAMAGPRSADRMINALNRNAPAIMLASGYADSVLPPSSLVPFFERLTGPKRLQLAPGDHGAPEWSGLRGRPNPVTDEAHAWLDHYLKGTANGVDTQPAVQFTDVVTGKIRRHTRWPAATDRAMLGPPDRDGSAAPGAAATWTATIRGGVDTVADGASGAIASGRYRAPQIRLDRFDTAHGVYWTGAPVPTGTVLDGSPKLSLRVSSSTGSTSLFAYLYDVDPSGRAALMSATPYSVTGAHTAKRVSFPLGPVGWTLSKGHRLALLIDTVDPRWTSLAGPGSTVRLSSAPGAPASLDLPLAG
jgi:putative CocE/NonD family hydrolase